MKRTALILALVGGATFVHADVVLTYSGLELANPKTVTIKVGSGSNRQVKAGALTFTKNGSVIRTYCIDAVRPLDRNPHHYHKQDVNEAGSDGLAAAARILGANFDAADTASKQAGLQLAVWSAIYDWGSGYTEFKANGANFKVISANSSTLNWAKTYFASAFNPMPAGKEAIAYITTANGGQSQMTVVPEPATMAALGLGVAALLRRRKKS